MPKPGWRYRFRLGGRCDRFGDGWIDDRGQFGQCHHDQRATLASYTYDPLDRLRLADDGTTRTRFRYVGQTTAIAQTVNDQTGVVIVSIGVDWTGEHRLDWTGTGSNVRFYGTNGHHDLTWTADATGAVSATLRYDPWGTLTSSTGSSLPAFRFQGSWADPATNLAWVITRWYAPALGTFISEDSLTGDPADPPSRHLYAYAQANPVLGWDPDGRFFRRVRFGETLESISKKLYGFSDAASLVRGNPGGRFTPIRLTFANPRVGAGQCIWIPFVNG